MSETAEPSSLLARLAAALLHGGSAANQQVHQALLAGPEDKDAVTTSFAVQACQPLFQCLDSVHFGKKGWAPALRSCTSGELLGRLVLRAGPERSGRLLQLTDALSSSLLPQQTTDVLQLLLALSDERQHVGEGVHGPSPLLLGSKGRLADLFQPPSQQRTPAGEDTAVQAKVQSLLHGDHKGINSAKPHSTAPGLGPVSTTKVTQAAAATSSSALPAISSSLAPASSSSLLMPHSSLLADSMLGPMSELGMPAFSALFGAQSASLFQPEGFASALHVPAFQPVWEQKIPEPVVEATQQQSAAATATAGAGQQQSMIGNRAVALPGSDLLTEDLWAEGLGDGAAPDVSSLEALPELGQLPELSSGRHHHSTGSAEEDGAFLRSPYLQAALAGTAMAEYVEDMGASADAEALQRKHGRQALLHSCAVLACMAIPSPIFAWGQQGAARAGAAARAESTLPLATPAIVVRPAAQAALALDAAEQALLGCFGEAGSTFLAVERVVSTLSAPVKCVCKAQLARSLRCSCCGQSPCLGRHITDTAAEAAMQHKQVLHSICMALSYFLRHYQEQLVQHMTAATATAAGGAGAAATAQSLPHLWSKVKSWLPLLQSLQSLLQPAAELLSLKQAASAAPAQQLVMRECCRSRAALLLTSGLWSRFAAEQSKQSVLMERRKSKKDAASSSSYLSAPALPSLLRSLSEAAVRPFLQTMSQTFLLPLHFPLSGSNHSSSSSAFARTLSLFSQGTGGFGKAGAPAAALLVSALGMPQHLTETEALLQRSQVLLRALSLASPRLLQLLLQCWQRLQEEVLQDRDHQQHHAVPVNDLAIYNCLLWQEGAAEALKEQLIDWAVQQATREPAVAALAEAAEEQALLDLEEDELEGAAVLGASLPGFLPSTAAGAASVMGRTSSSSMTSRQGSKRSLLSRAHTSSDSASAAAGLSEGSSLSGMLSAALGVPVMQLAALQQQTQRRSSGARLGRWGQHQSSSKSAAHSSAAWTGSRAYQSGSPLAKQVPSHVRKDVAMGLHSSHTSSRRSSSATVLSRLSSVLTSSITAAPSSRRPSSSSPFTSAASSILGRSMGAGSILSSFISRRLRLASSPQAGSHSAVSLSSPRNALSSRSPGTSPSSFSPSGFTGMPTARERRAVAAAEIRQARHEAALRFQQAEERRAEGKREQLQLLEAESAAAKAAKKAAVLRQKEEDAAFMARLTRDSASLRPDGTPSPVRGAWGTQQQQMEQQELEDARRQALLQEARQFLLKQYGERLAALTADKEQGKAGAFSGGREEGAEVAAATDGAVEVEEDGERDRSKEQASAAEAEKAAGPAPGVLLALDALASLGPQGRQQARTLADSMGMIEWQPRDEEKEQEERRKQQALESPGRTVAADGESFSPSLLGSAGIDSPIQGISERMKRLLSLRAGKKGSSPGAKDAAENFNSNAEDELAEGSSSSAPAPPTDASAPSIMLSQQAADLAAAELLSAWPELARLLPEDFVTHIRVSQQPGGRSTLTLGDEEQVVITDAAGAAEGGAGLASPRRGPGDGLLMPRKAHLQPAGGSSVLAGSSPVPVRGAGRGPSAGNGNYGEQGQEEEEWGYSRRVQQPAGGTSVSQSIIYGAAEAAGREHTGMGGTLGDAPAASTAAAGGPDGELLHVRISQPAGGRSSAGEVLFGDGSDATTQAMNRHTSVSVSQPSGGFSSMQSILFPAEESPAEGESKAGMLLQQQQQGSEQAASGSHFLHHPAEAAAQTEKRHIVVLQESGGGSSTLQGLLYPSKEEVAAVEDAEGSSASLIAKLKQARIQRADEVAAAAAAATGGAVETSLGTASVSDATEQEGLSAGPSKPQIRVLQPSGGNSSAADHLQWHEGEDAGETAASLLQKRKAAAAAAEAEAEAAAVSREEQLQIAAQTADKRKSALANATGELVTARHAGASAAALGGQSALLPAIPAALQPSQLDAGYSAFLTSLSEPTTDLSASVSVTSKQLLLLPLLRHVSFLETAVAVVSLLQGELLGCYKALQHWMLLGEAHVFCSFLPELLQKMQPRDAFQQQQQQHLLLLQHSSSSRNSRGGAASSAGDGSSKRVSMITALEDGVLGTDSKEPGDGGSSSSTLSSLFAWRKKRTAVSSLLLSEREGLAQSPAQRALLANTLLQRSLTELGHTAQMQQCLEHARALLGHKMGSSEGIASLITTMSSAASSAASSLSSSLSFSFSGPPQTEGKPAPGAPTSFADAKAQALKAKQAQPPSAHGLGVSSPAPDTAADRGLLERARYEELLQQVLKEARLSSETPVPSYYAHRFFYLYRPVLKAVSRTPLQDTGVRHSAAPAAVPLTPAEESSYFKLCWWRAEALDFLEPCFELETPPNLLDPSFSGSCAPEGVPSVAAMSMRRTQYLQQTVIGGTAAGQQQQQHLLQHLLSHGRLLQYILKPSTQLRYTAVHRFLLRVQRVKLELQQLWSSVTALEKRGRRLFAAGSPSPSPSPSLKNALPSVIHSCRHQAQCFITALEGYLSSQVTQGCYNRLLERSGLAAGRNGAGGMGTPSSSLATAGCLSIEDLKAAHDRFTEELLERCLLPDPCLLAQNKRTESGATASILRAATVSAFSGRDSVLQSEKQAVLSKGAQLLTDCFTCLLDFCRLSQEYLSVFIQRAVRNTAAGASAGTTTVASVATAAAGAAPSPSDGASAAALQGLEKQLHACRGKFLGQLQTMLAVLQAMELQGSSAGDSPYADLQERLSSCI